ncbi:MAG: arginine--tRNA ligase [Verrucomicrobiales bacterium]|nr:arginine--tRNA ligase [Verrucomicrobiales bacterium]
MTYPNQIEKLLRCALEKTSIAAELPADLEIQVGPSTDARFGDYQSNVAMVLAKRLKTNPRALATEIIEHFEPGDLCQPAEIAGPGFINLRITASSLEAGLIAQINDPERLGLATLPASESKNIVIDFSAPNIAKPMHVGHIRSTIIGDCLSRVSRELGHQVTTDNHIGDWGTQFGMIIYGWKNFLDQDALTADPIEALLEIYKKVNDACSDDAVREACRTELVKLQQGDAENLAIWQQCVDLSRSSLEKIYAQLDVKFDHWLGESFYNDRLAPLVQSLKDDGLAQESDGAQCIFFLDDPDLAERAPCMVQKRDGGFNYATTDIATIEYRVEEFSAEHIWYVVGAEQKLHFDQIFAVAKKRGLDTQLSFIPFGSIMGKDGKRFKTRSGDTVSLTDVLDEAVERAAKIISEKNPDFSAQEMAEISRIIGIGSVKYAELSQNRLTNYIFDWDNMLSFKGNTAPYLINAYVRTRAIFRKLGSEFEGIQSVQLTEDAEKTLALKLAQYAEAVPTVLTDFRPNLLANYLYELANTFHSFYEHCPVLRSEGQVRATRLALCDTTSKVLKKGLGLLGIQTTERM